MRGVELDVLFAITIRALHLGLAHRRTLKLLIYGPFQKGRVLAQDGDGTN